jgi:hypothetical protein
VGRAAVLDAFLGAFCIGTRASARTHTRVCTRARAHTHTHSRTHARTHARTPNTNTPLPTHPPTLPPRRESTAPIDLFYGHISGMDALARGLRAAARLIEQGRLQKLGEERYASWRVKKGLGEKIVNYRVRPAAAAAAAAGPAGLMLAPRAPAARAARAAPTRPSRALPQRGPAAIKQPRGSAAALACLSCTRPPFPAQCERTSSAPSDPHHRPCFLTLPQTPHPPKRRAGASSFALVPHRAPQVGFEELEKWALHHRDPALDVGSGSQELAEIYLDMAL